MLALMPLLGRGVDKAKSWERSVAALISTPPRAVFLGDDMFISAR